MQTDHPHAPAVAPRPTAPVGGLSSGGATDRPGGASGGVDDACTAGSLGDWPAWARPQLEDAVALVAGLPRGRRGPGLAAELHRRWYGAPIATSLVPRRGWGPLGGVYRRAHAGSAAPLLVHGIAVVDRHDVIGPDGWWRTWGDRWLPTRSRADSVRVMFSPRPDTLPAFVSLLTSALLDLDEPWLLSCATDPGRLRRSGAAQLHVPDETVLTRPALERLAPLLLDAAPPLCRPLAPGVAVAQDPATGPTFGAQRCHLVAAGLRSPASCRDPLRAIARTFARHGIDPSAPHRSRP